MLNEWIKNNSSLWFSKVQHFELFPGDFVGFKMTDYIKIREIWSPKKFNPVKANFWFFQWHLGSYPGKISFLIFIFQVIYCYFIDLSIILIKFGFLMHFGSEKLTQWPLILLSKNKLISNILYKNRLCYLKSRCDVFIIKGSWMAPYIAAWSMMYLLQIVCYAMK